MLRKSTPILILFLLAFLLGCSGVRYFSIGMRLEKLGRYNDALSAYQAALAQTSEKDAKLQSLIYFRTGECLVQLDRIQEAFRAFEHSAVSDGSNVHARIRLGEFFLSGGAADRAAEQAEVVLRISPSSGEGLALWGASMEGLGRKDKAKQAYREALAVEPSRISVAIALADLYNQDNQTKEAKAVLEESAKLNAKSAAPVLAMARLHEQEGEIGDAELSYRQAVRVEDTPETNLRLAQFLQRTSRIAESEQVLRRVDAQRPGTPTALADFELLAGRPTNALDSYEAALGEYFGEAKKGKAEAAIRGERAALAARIVEADVELAAQKDGDERTAAVKHARNYLAAYAAEMDAATIAILESEIALAENNLPLASAKVAAALALAPRSAAALYTNGVVRMRCVDAAGARDQWGKALEADSHFAPARLALAEQALEHGDAKGAENYVLQVVRDEPGNVRALEVFARVLTAEKQYTSAGIIARRAQALDGDSPTPHLLLGHIALQQRREGEALLQFEQAVLLDPHSKEAVEGLTKLYDTGRITRPMLAKMEGMAKTPPVSATLMEITGRLYAAHGWTADAKRCLEAALHLDPRRATAAALLAKTFAAGGNLRAAADSAAKLGGDSANLLAAMKAQDGNDLNGAIQNYERAVRGGEKSGVAANNLAWLYAQQGRQLDRALELARTAQSLLPRNPAVLDTLGFVHLRLREYSEAIRALESAQQLAAKEPAGPELLAQIRQHLAEAYLRPGEKAAAAARD